VTLPEILTILFQASVFGSALLITFWVLRARFFSRQHLQERAEELDTLIAFARAIFQTPSELEELAEVAYIEAARLVDTDFFQLGLYEGQNYRTLICVREGHSVENRVFDLSHDHDPNEILSWIRKEQKPLSIGDFHAGREDHPKASTAAYLIPPTSGIFVPLLDGEETMGMLSVGSVEPYAFDNHHLRLMQVLAQSLAAALARALLRIQLDFRAAQMLLMEEIARQLVARRPLEDRLQEVCSLTRQAYDLHTVSIYQLNGRQLTVTAQAADQKIESDRALLRAVLKNRRFAARTIQGMKGASDSPSSDNFEELAFPIIAEDYVLGVLQIITRLPGSLSAEERSHAEMITASIAMAMLESRNYALQQEETWITTVLLEVARHAATPGDNTEALQAVLQLTTLLTGTKWAALFLPGGVEHLLRIGPAAGLRRSTQLTLFELETPLKDLGIPEDLAEETPYTVILPDPLSDAMDTDQATAIILAERQDLLGVLLLEGSQLDARHLSLTQGIAHQISLRLANARLIEEAATRRSLERELEAARKIQESFLPRTIPTHPGWEIGVTWRVARDVGGDFYDFIELPAGPQGPRWGIAIADVTDKGIPAALFMALSKTLLRTLAVELIDPSKTLAKLNDLLLTDTHGGLLVSVFLLLWEPETGAIQYANAGHNPPLLLRPEEPALLLEEHGTVLGALPDMCYQTYSGMLHPGELLVLYTDGATEAFDSQGQMFGLQRLRNVVMGMRDWNAQKVADQILERVDGFCGGVDLSDDLTAIILHRSN